MNTKQISIKQFLSDRGITPVRENNNSGVYLSPLRTEQTPSFKVDYVKNIWYDFGSGEGGSIIDLVMKLEHCTTAEAFAKLENSSFLSHRNEPSTSAEPVITVNSVKPLASPQLINYIHSRGIDIDIAKRYCSEVHFTNGGKNYYAIGFRCDSGGWELRNQYFKGGTSPKGITTIDKNSSECMVFEGFMDMLSYLSLKKTPELSINIAVMNSVVNISKASDFLKRHTTLRCFFDNDEAGRRALAQIRSYDVKVIDCSHIYSKYNDLNDYIKSKINTPKLPHRGVKMNF